MCIFNILLIIITFVYGLEVDEKLPVRIINVSDSLKTILINRGVEDGLLENDHAKFYLTTGVVARGVLVKVSPSRSVWSLYRVSKSDEIAAEKMMNLKITAAVKLTNDPTKMLRKYDDPLGETKDVLLTPVGKGPKSSTSITEEMKAFPDLSKHTWELWSTIHVSNLMSSNSIGTDGEGNRGSASSLDVMLGIEKYFNNLNHWFGRLSFSPFFHLYKQKYSSIQGNQIQNSFVGYGLGAQYHFLAHPLSLNRWIWWVNLGAGMGKCSDSVTLSIDTTTTTKINTPIDLTGKGTFYFLGTGLKYNFHQNFSMRMNIDYYTRAESYTISSLDGESRDPYTKKITGIRVLIGPSLRFY